jgi:hypothetical protein
MSYDLHIERVETNPGGDPVALTVDEWREAVRATEGVRWSVPGEHAIVNPETGERIAFMSREGDVEVFFSQDGEWRLAFRWQQGPVAFTLKRSPDDAADPIWAAALALAPHLGAAIRGDKGEYYFRPKHRKVKALLRMLRTILWRR